MEDHTNFNEDQWLRILFLISDTDKWLQHTEVNHFYQLPFKNRKKLLRKSWYLSASALAHILERHYYKIARYPATSKFTISIAEIVAYIRDTFHEPSFSVAQSTNIQRVLDTGVPIGFDCKGTTVHVVTVISDIGGRIITAFPGRMLDSTC